MNEKKPPKEKEPSLKDFLAKDSPVVFLTDANQVDKTKDHVILVGASWCGYSQLGVPQFSTACSSINDKDKKCMVADITNPKCLKAVKDLGLNPQAYPDHFFFNAKEGKYEEHVGMQKVPEMKQILSKKGFNIQ